MLSSVDKQTAPAKKAKLRSYLQINKLRGEEIQSAAILRQYKQAFSRYTQYCGAAGMSV